MPNKDIVLSRTDAMDRCISLGKKFIQHFDKIYKHPESDARIHWMTEMESWYKKVKEIKLKQSNDYILSGELRDWFFTAGANPQDFMQNPTNEELKIYDNFTNKLISGNNIQTALRSINIMNKGFKVTYKDRTFKVKAKDHQDAANKVIRKYKDGKSLNKDERLSPMTYKKLKELGYDSEKWKGMTQEQANKIVQEGSKTENKPKTKEGARNNFKNLEKEETKSAFSNKPDYSKHSKEVQDVGELTEEYIKDIEENVNEYSSDDIEDLASELTHHIYRKLFEKYDMEESDVVDIMSEINRPFRELAEKPKKFDLKSFASNVRKNLFEAFKEKGIK